MKLIIKKYNKKIITLMTKMPFLIVWNEIFIYIAYFKNINKFIFI